LPVKQKLGTCASAVRAGLSSTESLRGVFGASVLFLDAAPDV